MNFCSWSADDLTRVADFPVFEFERAYWSKTDEYQQLPMYKKHSSLQWAFLEMRIISAKTWVQRKPNRFEMPLSPRQQKQKLWPKMEARKPKQIKKSLSIWSIYPETSEVHYEGTQELKACEGKKQYHVRLTELPPMNYKQYIKISQEVSYFRKLLPAVKNKSLLSF